jgi:hypothetical protein
MWDFIYIIFGLFLVRNTTFSSICGIMEVLIGGCKILQRSSSSMDRSLR